MRGISIGFTLPSRGKGSTAAISSAVETLARINEVILSEYDIPPLFLSGVIYKRENPGKEKWQNILEILHTGNGDCEDLAAWRIAELRDKGHYAQPLVKGKNGQYHILVIRKKNGKMAIEDPSKILGMQ